MLSSKIDELFSHQLSNWELAKTNYSQLGNVLTKGFNFGSFEVFVQYNRERMRSSAAKVDPKSIGERPCFLCDKNRPAEQLGLPVFENLVILVNPFPIFSRHLTIPSSAHTDQRIVGNFDKLLSLAKAMDSYVLFYNGPQCGASAPDHFHFQAGNRGFMPIESDFQSRRFSDLISSKPGVQVWKWSSYLRGIITLQGTDMKALEHTFNDIYLKLNEEQPDKPEPMLNILTEFSSGGWIIHIIPRHQHRPSRFFSTDDSQILVSPAAVDIGGVIITPREEDFNKICSKDIEEIFGQVCFNDDEINSLLRDII